MSAAALALAPGRDVKVLAALALARVGDAARAKAMVEELEKSDPLNTVLKLYWLPTLKAAIELNGGNSAQALEFLEAAAPYELGEPPPFQTELCIQLIFAARPTSRRTTAAPPRRNFRNFLTIAAS